MTDHTLSQTELNLSGFFDRRGRRGILADLIADFRAVPAGAWMVLAVATVMSNLFIALA